MKVLVIAETNWIEDIALAQDLRSAYLLQLKDEGKPQVRFCEGAHSSFREEVAMSSTRQFMELTYQKIG